MSTTLQTMLFRLASERPDLREELLGLQGPPTLRVRTLRLAAMNEELRPVLLEVLQKTAESSTSVVQQPPIVISQPPIIVQQEIPPAPAAPVVIQPPAAPVAPAPAAPVPVPVFIQPTPVLAPAPLPAPEPAPLPAPLPAPEPVPPVDLLPLGLINERTRRGFDADLRPELDRMLGSGMTREQAAGQLIAQINDAFKQKVYLYNVLIRHQSTFETDDVFREGLIKACQVWMSEGSPADGRG